MAASGSKKRTEYLQVIEGEWVDIVWSGFKEQCCSCGLVHIVDYRVNPSGGLQFRAKVDNRATAAVRKSFKFTKEEE